MATADLEQNPAKPLTRAHLSARDQVAAWFARRSWKPFRFQRQAWLASLRGQSGLIHATTGTGKTYAALFGPVMDAIAQRQRHVSSEGAKSSASWDSLRVLWITPLRALAADTQEAIQTPLVELGLPWNVETRTGDTSQSIRNRQRKRLPSVLITTPESLSLMLTRDNAREQFANLHTVIVDEWHELLSTKRGIQAELALARLRRWQPSVRTWGLSATLGNIDEAMAVLLGPNSAAEGVQIEGMRSKRNVVDAVIPETVDRFPWAGHLGLKLLPNVIKEIDSAATSLVFTNTRSQTEAWYQAILELRPEWAESAAWLDFVQDRQ